LRFTIRRFQAPCAPDSGLARGTECGQHCVSEGVQRYPSVRAWSDGCRSGAYGRPLRRQQPLPVWAKGDL